MELEVRPAGAGEMAAVRRIAARFGLLDHWPAGPDFLDCEQRYGRLLVARRGGEVIAFGGVQYRGSVTHLGDLFVDPAYQAAGVGRALLDGLLPEPGPRVTIASADPRAVPLYIRYGMIPRCPLYYLTGELPGTGEVSIVDVSEVVAADAAASGGDREETLRWYAGLDGVRVYRSADGYAFAREVDDDVLLGPAGGGTPAGCCAAVLAVAARYPGRTVRLAVFGVHPLLPRLLAAGLRIEDTDTYLTSEDGLVPLDRYLPSPDLG